MRFLSNLLILVGVALCVGFGLSWYALSDAAVIGSMRIGPWTAWQEAGSPTPDPYTRAHVARAGALQLGASEGLQFIARTDSDGQRLDRACRYRIDGTTPLAAFWTLTAVDDNYSIITRPDTSIALNSTRVARVGDGSLQLYVSKGLSPRHWLEITGDGPFGLVLTVYDTSNPTEAGLESNALPAIIRESCP